MKKVTLLFTFFLYVITSLVSVEILQEVTEYYEDEEYSRIINKLEMVDMLTPELNYLLAESYLYSITDAKSWMKYNIKYQDSIIQCLEDDPNNVLYQLNSARGMMWFPSARGSREDGIKLLQNLEEKSPQNIEVLYAISNFRFSEDRLEEAKEGFLTILEIEPIHKYAQKSLDIIELDEKHLTIRNITFIDNQKTSSERLQKKVGDFRGNILDKYTRKDIRNRLMEIISINAVDINGLIVDDSFVDLEIKVKEESSKILMFQQVSGGGLDYDNDISLSGLMPPVTIFIDNNLFGYRDNV